MTQKVQRRRIPYRVVKLLDMRMRTVTNHRMWNVGNLPISNFIFHEYIQLFCTLPSQLALPHCTPYQLNTKQNEDEDSKKRNTSTKCIDMNAVQFYVRQPYENFFKRIRSEGMGYECTCTFIHDSKYECDIDTAWANKWENVSQPINVKEKDESVY